MAASRTVWVVGSGTLATVLIALPFKTFDLDRYFVPKELTLHLTALCAVTAVAWSARRMALSRVDSLLAAFLVLSALSAALARNPWIATRALAVTLSSVALFWTARSLARGGSARVLLAIMATAVTIAAATALLQAYGVRSEVFSLNRAPGGTLGNRNSVAHLAAIGIPALVLSALTAPRAARTVCGALGVALIAAALVLSRSRAAWLALVIAMIGVAWYLWRARRRLDADHGVLARGSGLSARGALLAAGAAAGILAAVVLPNTLHWKSRSPYLDSALGVADYREGSGHGRLVQYGNTGRLALQHPVLGVGPGNWPVAYPRVVPPGDPSLDHDTGMTENPWPSSDWAAMLAERGVPALICLLLAFAGLLVEATRSVTAPDGSRDGALAGLALVATIVIIGVVGAFDAVLLLPTSALIAWSLLGTLDGMLLPQPAPRLTLTPSSRRGRALLLAGVATVEVAAVAHSAAAATAMAVDANAEGMPGVSWAARIDPGSYRILMRLATLAEQRRDCRVVHASAGRAHALFPAAAEPVRLLAACEANGHRATRR